MMEGKSLLILLIIILSFGLFLTGCTSSPSSDTYSYIIGGTVTVDEGNNVEDVTLRVYDSSGTSTVYPDSNGKWGTIVSEGYVTVTPLYDIDADGQNDYDFTPSNWSKYVGGDRSGIDFTGTFSSYSNPTVQEMLGEWEFTYYIGTSKYVEYYVFDNLIETETGQCYVYGYKDGEDTPGEYQLYGTDNPAVATYSKDEGIFTVLWLSPDIYGYGSYFEFNFTSSTTVSGDYYMISDDELLSPESMTGEREPLTISSLSTANNTVNDQAEELIEQLKQKVEESKEVSITSDTIDNDVEKKIEIKENALKN